MIRSVKKKKITASLLIALFLLLAMAPAGLAQRRRPSKTKHLAVGAAAGAVGGALIGGRKGALIGAGAGAGAGYLVYRHKKRKARRR